VCSIRNRVTIAGAGHGDSGHPAVKSLLRVPQAVRTRIATKACNEASDRSLGEVEAPARRRGWTLG
jgi:hypothetical protein